MNDGKVVPIKKQEVHRLTKESYEQLEKQVSHVGINSSTTPTEAAYKLGVQSVLQVLRTGWVIG